MGGWAAQTRWQKSGGHGFPVNLALTPEAVLSKWDVITNFGKRTHSHVNSGGQENNIVMQTTVVQPIL